MLLVCWIPILHFVSDIECAAPDTPSGGTRSYSCTTLNCAATFACSSGYERVSGSTSRTCGGVGVWSGSDLVCRSASFSVHSDSYKTCLSHTHFRFLYFHLGSRVKRRLSSGDIILHYRLETRFA